MLTARVLLTLGCRTKGVNEAIHDTRHSTPRPNYSFIVRRLTLTKSKMEVLGELFKKALYFRFLKETDTYMGCASMRGMQGIPTEHPKINL